QPAVSFELFEMTEEAWLARAREGIPFPGIPGWTPSGSPLRTWSVVTAGDANSSSLASTDLGGGERLGAGYYYLRSPGGAWNAGVLFSVVDTQVITKLSFDELLVWVLDHETGAPVSGVEVRADGPGAAGATVRTDADGVATLPVPRPSE